MRKQLFTMLAALCLALVLLPGTAWAIGDFSNEYRASQYYQALKKVTLTGNQRSDLLAVAASQIGYYEGNTATQLDGSFQGNKNYSEYGWYLGSNGTAWCSEFASWCARKANIPTSVLGNSKGANIKNFGAPAYTWDETIYAGGTFTPRPGDLVLFAWDGSSIHAKNLSHTAVVENVDRQGDKVIIGVIHGNSGDAVRRSKISANVMDGYMGKGYIVYFVAPRYTSAPVSRTCTVTFNANGGKISTAKKEYKSNAALGTLPTPTRTGYKFNGWYTAASGGKKVTAATKVTANMTLYAHWTKAAAKTYTITLDANGGKVSPSSIKAGSGNTYYSSLPTPTRAGYKFTGWYTAKSGGTKITSSTKAAADCTIYARWTRSRTYMVTFDPNEGAVFQDWKSVVTGSSYRTLPTPTRPGYHFKGWYTKRSGGVKVTETTRVNLKANQTLYAQWQTSVTARSPQSGSWQVTVPAGYELALYATSTNAKAAATLELGGDQVIRCTKKAALSNGTVRYYGKVNNRDYWFTHSCEMDV